MEVTGGAAGPRGLPFLTGLASAAMFLASVWVPPAGFMLTLGSPLPVALAAARGGLRGGLTAFLAAAAAVLVIGGPVGASLYVAQLGAPGAVLGLAERARRPAHAVVGGYVALAALGTALVFTALALATGMSPGAWLHETVQQTREIIARAVGPAGSDPQAAVALQEALDRTAAVLEKLFPGLFTAVTMITGWLNAVALRRLLQDPGAPSWIGWRAPEPLIWGLLGAGFLGTLGPGAIRVAAWNVFLALGTVYFFQGLAVMQHLFVTRGFPRLFRGAAYALIFLQFPVMLLVAAVGAFDLWFDFRARWSPSRPPGEGE